MSSRHKKCGGKIVPLPRIKSHIKKYECNRCNQVWTKYNRKKQ